MFQKHLGLILDVKLNFVRHIKISSLLTIYKAFIRSRLDYTDAIYGQAYNSSFHEKLESLQYNACLAITGAIIRDIIRKTIPRVRVRISKITTLL